MESTRQLDLALLHPRTTTFARVLKIRKRRSVRDRAIAESRG
jgi:hypothetical protein